MNRIAIILQGCPAGALGPYGNEWIATPNLDAFAAEGIVFDRHISDDPTPEAARRAWWPKSDEPRFLIRANRPERDILGEWTQSFDARPGANPAEALDRILPDVLNQLKSIPNWTLAMELDRLIPPWTVPRELFGVYLEDLIGEDAAEAPEPWSDPPVGWFDIEDRESWELLHRSFAAVVTQLDAELGWIFERFREFRLQKSADWLVTSDFGYPLGEHGQLGPHRPWLHTELVHLPLIVRRGDGANACERVRSITQPTDLNSILNRRPLPKRPVAITVGAWNGAKEIARRSESSAILLALETPEDDDPREPMWFGKPDDRWEVNNIRSQNLDEAEVLEAEMRNEPEAGAKG